MFLESIQSERESRSYYNTLLNVDDPNIHFIDRLEVWSELDIWFNRWADSKLPFVMLGEEGDGKTWSVASWLRRKKTVIEEFPAIIFISSLNAISNEPIIQLSTTVNKYIPNLSIEQWRRRISRWTSDSPEKAPRIILVLDGINEHQLSSWWRILFQNLKGAPWCKSVAVICTCRTAFWLKYFDKLRSMDNQSYILPPYNEKELNPNSDIDI